MKRNERELTEGLRLAGVAVVSAVLVASVVIAVGEHALSRSEPSVPAETALLVRTGG